MLKTENQPPSAEHHPIMPVSLDPAITPCQTGPFHGAIVTFGRYKGCEMEILGWIVIGLLIGSIAKLIMPGRDAGGCFITMLLGIAGALLAGYVGRLVGFYRAGEQAGFIAATLGAVAILAGYRFVTRK